MTDNITLPRELVEKALEALGFWDEFRWGNDRGAVAALRTALAAEQPKQEPVAWRPRLSPNIAMHWNRPWNDGVPSAQTADYWNRSGQGVEYAYAAPPEDEALRRDAERYRWLRTNCYSDKYPYSEFDSAMQLSFTVSGIWANNRDPAVLDGCLDTAMGGET